MTIAALLKKFKEDEAELLLAHVLRVSKEFLHLHPEHELSQTQIDKFQRLISRLRQGIPAAYLLGYKYFFGLKFKVRRSVLIPRPESEWLVETGLKFLKRRRGHQRVLDLGTGSGNLIISLAAKAVAARAVGASREWVAADISTGALKVAQQNAHACGAQVKFIESDLFAKIPGKFDLILANLPYVPASDYRKLHKNLKFEPVRALTDNSDGASIIKRFLHQLPNRLRPNALALIEIDPTHKKILPQFVKQEQLNLTLKFYKDFRGLDRYVKITVGR